MDEAEIKRRVSQYSFYHTIPLTSTIVTPGNPAHLQSQANITRVIEGLDLRGKKVLDVGCRDGFFSFMAERRGASEVIGIDINHSKAAVEFLIPYFDSRCQIHEMNLYDLTPNTFGLFDVVFFAGVLYHLRYPFWALKVLKDVLKPSSVLMLETAIFYGAEKHAMLYCPVGKDSPYGPTSCTFFNKKALVDTLSSLGWHTRSIHELHPELGATKSSSQDPVISRAVVVCDFSEKSENNQKQQYWDGQFQTTGANRAVMGAV
jgi:2-polyprenyl-3-methyl-5-hydroxy-6-metoxy-1,4-benzoquinol methylase